MTAPKIMAASESFATEVDGREVLVSAGTRVRATDPLVKALPHLFAPVDPQADLDTRKR